MDTGCVEFQTKAKLIAVGKLLQFWKQPHPQDSSYEDFRVGCPSRADAPDDSCAAVTVETWIEVDRLVEETVDCFIHLFP